MADSKSRQILRRARKINNSGIIVAIGCYIENILQEKYKTKNNFIIKNNTKNNKNNIKNSLLNDIDIYIGNYNKTHLVEIVEGYLDKKEKSIEYIDVNDEIEFKEFSDNLYITNNRAFVKIEDGCNQFCTYCIIPYVRGRVRSREKDNILKEIMDLAKKGIKEIVLTGIHIASFSNENYDLIDLVYDINKIEGIKRIRLGSIEPSYLNFDNIERIKNITKLCHQFHLSLQSASNNILKRMNRKYTIEEFIEVAEKLKETFEDCILTTDVIVGFPR